jgi:hypothetical protein
MSKIYLGCFQKQIPFALNKCKDSNWNSTPFCKQNSPAFNSHLRFKPPKIYAVVYHLSMLYSLSQGNNMKQ